MDTVHPHCAGLDVHKDTVVACVRHHDGGRKARQEVRTFPTHTRGLEELADWLAAEGVTHAAMESTRVYWKPVFNVLEGRVTVLLVNAHHIKQVPGRKTDVGVCAWIAQLLQLEHLDHLDRLVTQLDARIEQLTAPDAEALLTTTPGIKRHTAEVLLAEVGPTVDPFPTAGQLASWAGMCPGTNESAGKRRAGRTRRANRWLRQAVVQAGWAASRSKRTYLGARYRRVARRRGVKRALMAVGHTPLVIVYHVLRKREAYREIGADYYDRLQPERLTRHLIRRLEQLGHEVTLEDRTAEERAEQPG